MKVREVRWRNYRRLPDGQLLARKHVVLVGPNDCGKTSVLRAIHLCLGISNAQLTSVVQLRDLSSPDEPMFVELVLDQFSDDERSAFPDEIDVGPERRSRSAFKQESILTMRKPCS